MYIRCIIISLLTVRNSLSMQAFNYVMYRIAPNFEALKFRGIVRSWVDCLPERFPGRTFNLNLHM